MNPAILIAAAAALAYFYKDQLFGSATGTAPAITAGQTAASSAAAAGATPAQQAAAAASAIAATSPAPLVQPTIQLDNPTVHNALTALGQATSADALNRALTLYALKDSDYLLNVSQWNWYQAGSGVNQQGIITGATEAGDNAIPASRYLQLRQARGLV